MTRVLVGSLLLTSRSRTLALSHVSTARLSGASSVATRAVVAVPNHRASVNTVAAVAVAALLFAAPLATLSAQAAQTFGRGGSVTPYAGYMVTGRMIEGPLGTNLSTANSPVIGAQLAIPLVPGLSLTGGLGYSSGDLRVGVPILGGVNVGTNRMFMYDAGLELGGRSRERGIAPFVQAGVGGITNELSNRLLNTRSTNLVFTGGVGVDIGLSRSLALRLQAKDYVGRFDTREALGVGGNGNLSHNWALSAGVKLGF